MVNSLADYTTEDLEALERERPELGRVELIDGALHATGESALGIPHQLIMQRLHLLLAPRCPAGLVVMLDTWWHYVRANGLSGKIRADVAAYRLADLPAAGKVFRSPPRFSLEILSDDAVHDLVAKDDVYAEHGTRRAYLDPDERGGWWWKADGVEHTAATATWQPDGWPPLTLDRGVLLAPPSAGVTVA
jgi:hypothetical protein